MQMMSSKESTENPTPVRRTSRARKVNSRFVDDADESYKKLVDRITASDTNRQKCESHNTTKTVQNSCEKPSLVNGIGGKPEDTSHEAEVLSGSVIVKYRNSFESDTSEDIKSPSSVSGCQNTNKESINHVDSVYSLTESSASLNNELSSVVHSFKADIQPRVILSRTQVNEKSKNKSKEHFSGIAVNCKKSDNSSVPSNMTNSQLAFSSDGEDDIPLNQLASKADNQKSNANWGKNKKKVSTNSKSLMAKSQASITKEVPAKKAGKGSKPKIKLSTGLFKKSNKTSTSKVAPKQLLNLKLFTKKISGDKTSNEKKNGSHTSENKKPSKSSIVLGGSSKTIKEETLTKDGKVPKRKIEAEASEKEAKNKRRKSSIEEPVNHVIPNTRLVTMSDLVLEIPVDVQCSEKVKDKESGKQITNQIENSAPSKNIAKKTDIVVKKEVEFPMKSEGSSAKKSANACPRNNQSNIAVEKEAEVTPVKKSTDVSQKKIIPKEANVVSEAEAKIPIKTEVTSVKKSTYVTPSLKDMPKDVSNQIKKEKSSSIRSFEDALNLAESPLPTKQKVTPKKENLNSLCKTVPKRLLEDVPNDNFQKGLLVLESSSGTFVIDTSNDTDSNSNIEKKPSKTNLALKDIVKAELPSEKAIKPEKMNKIHVESTSKKVESLKQETAQNTTLPPEKPVKEEETDKQRFRQHDKSSHSKKHHHKDSDRSRRRSRDRHNSDHKERSSSSRHKSSHRHRSSEKKRENHQRVKLGGKIKEDDVVSENLSESKSIDTSMICEEDAVILDKSGIVTKFSSSDLVEIDQLPAKSVNFQKGTWEQTKCDSPKLKDDALLQSTSVKSESSIKEKLEFAPKVEPSSDSSSQLQDSPCVKSEFDKTRESNVTSDLNSELPGREDSANLSPVKIEDLRKILSSASFSPPKVSPGEPTLKHEPKQEVVKVCADPIISDMKYEVSSVSMQQVSPILKDEQSTFSKLMSNTNHREDDFQVVKFGENSLDERKVVKLAEQSLDGNKIVKVGRDSLDGGTFANDNGITDGLSDISMTEDNEFGDALQTPGNHIENVNYTSPEVTNSCEAVMNTSIDRADNSQESPEEIEKRNKEIVLQRLQSFEHLTENLYLIERKKNHSKEVRRMVCDCYLSKEDIANNGMGCGDDCLNRLLMIECGYRCPLKERCLNRQFQNKSYAKVEVFNAENKGCGIRTTMDIEPGSFIMEYVGEVFDYKEFRRRRKEYAKESSAHFYFMALRSDTLIDATRKGNISRFVNHSCDPNAETQKWTVNGDVRIGFFATRFIGAGEEINFDYRLERYGREPQKCYCGTSVCRGWLGEAPDEQTREEKEEFKKKELKDKRKREEKRNYFDDLNLANEIEKLNLRGLRNRQDTLNLSRLMVRAEDTEARLSLLQLLMSAHQACKRLFLDYHGLKLLWSWMADLGSKSCNMELKLEIMKVLESLPITNRTQLTDSRVLLVVEKWRETERDSTSPETEANDETKKLLLSDNSSQVDNSSPDSGDSSEAATLQKEIEKNHIEEAWKSVVSLAERLLTLWKGLSEAFRIPKKERLEIMKEHEREVEKGYNEFMKREKASTSSYYDRRSPDREDWIKKRTKRPRREWDVWPKIPEFSDEDKSLSKEERREKFALRVAQEEEESKQRKDMQMSIWNYHLHRCSVLGQDASQTPIFDPSGEFYWDPVSVNWQRHHGIATNLPVPANYESTPEDEASPSTPIIQESGFPQAPTNLPLSFPINMSSNIPQLPIEARTQQIQSPQLEPPVPVVLRIPPKWDIARTCEGIIYFYHTKTRLSQWNLPTPDQHQELMSRYGLEDDSDTESDSTSSDSEDFSSEEEDMEERSSVVCSTDGGGEKMVRRKRGTGRRSEKLVQERVISPILFEDREAARIERRQAKDRAREEARQERYEAFQGPSADLSPEEEEVEEVVKPVRKKSGHYKIKSKTRALNALADNSEAARRAKEHFRSKMATFIVSVLNPYRKSDCKQGRITSTEDFKFLARKLTHFVMVKELKQLPNTKKLDCSESVKNKTREFIRKYMSKFKEDFKRDPFDTREY